VPHAISRVAESKHVEQLHQGKANDRRGAVNFKKQKSQDKEDDMRVV